MFAGPGWWRPGPIPLADRGQVKPLKSLLYWTGGPGGPGGPGISEECSAFSAAPGSMRYYKIWLFQCLDGCSGGVLTDIQAVSGGFAGADGLLCRES